VEGAVFVRAAHQEDEMSARRVQFRGWLCRVERASYGHTDRIALPLYDVHDGSPVAVATVHMPELALAADEVVIKDYSENEGMLSLLVAEGIVSPPLRAVQSGYVVLYVCRCLL
jgi:hypothetical protein